MRKPRDRLELVERSAGVKSEAAPAFTMGTGTRARRHEGGARQRLTLSPTPPVECLSTLIPGTLERSSTRPEWSMAWVSATVSASVMPRKKMAMRSAVIW